MSFAYDTTGIEEGGMVMKPGWYPFQIIEAEETTSKKGYPMVKAVCQCLDSRYSSKQIWHYVTFLPKDNSGAGIAKHFLKCIGEPFEGPIEVDADNWAFKQAKFMGKVATDEYNGQPTNKIVSVSPWRENGEQMAKAINESVPSDDDIPFE